MNQTFEARHVSKDEAKRWTREAVVLLWRRSGIFAAWTLVLVFAALLPSSALAATGLTANWIVVAVGGGGATGAAAITTAAMTAVA